MMLDTIVKQRAIGINPSGGVGKLVGAAVVRGEVTSERVASQSHLPYLP